MKKVWEKIGGLMSIPDGEGADMGFEPEKVQRLWLDYEDAKGGWEGDFVHAADYDQLLALYREAQSKVTGLIISEYQVSGYEDDPVGAPRIVRHTSPFYEGVRWAVNWRGRCLANNGIWEFEPIPSSRTDAFYARCRLPSVEVALQTLLSSKDPDGPMRRGM